MIPNVDHGSGMHGLMRYLVSQDDRLTEKTGNVHENPHVIGGDPFLMAYYGAEELDYAAGREVADYLETPRLTYGTKVREQITEADPDTGNKKVVGYRDAHVWHASLAVAPGDGVRSEEEWANIAQDFMDRMEFTEASGKAPARWVAIHHGKSRNGNDHIHIAASLVREDGTKVSTFRDQKRSQEAARELEKKYGLVQVAGRAGGAAARGWHRSERSAADRAGSTLTPPEYLALRVRAAAVASTSEAEWIRRLRADRLVVKPWFAKGTTDVVSGYKVAIKPDRRDERLVFYGGKTLGDDLSLPRLREQWPAPSIEQASEASAEWQAAFRGKAPVNQAGREMREVKAEASKKAADHFAAFNDRLSATPTTDRAAWAMAARDVSGALSAWARYDTANRDALYEAARVVGRSAQERRPAHPPARRAPGPSPMGTALLFVQASPQSKGKIAAQLLMRQVLVTATALRDFHGAHGNWTEATRMHEQVVQRLEAVPLTSYTAGAAPARDAGRGAPAVRPVVGADRDTTSAAPVPRTVQQQQRSQTSMER